jgi:hypothetical protein
MVMKRAASKAIFLAWFIDRFIDSEVDFSFKIGIRPQLLGLFIRIHTPPHTNTHQVSDA